MASLNEPSKASGGCNTASGEQQITCASKQALDVKLLCSRGWEEGGGGRGGGGDEGDWYASHSLSALSLTLHHIVADCRLHNQPVLEEFPPLPPSSQPPEDGAAHSTTSLPSLVQVHLDCCKLSEYLEQLRAMVALYQQHIQWLSSDSRLSFGCIRGSKVAVLVETSDKVVEDECLFDGVRAAVKTLLSEQLLHKEAVYLMSFGSKPETENPKMLPFKANSIQSLKCALLWLSGLSASGSCDVAGALRVALDLPDVDTICLVLSTEPNQQFELLTDFLVDELSGDWKPRLQLVAFNCSPHTAICLERVAQQTNGSFHQVSISDTRGSSELIRDSDILQIQEEIAQAKQTIADITKLQQGTVEDDVISTLREISLATDVEWPALLGAAGTNHVARVCSTLEWLKDGDFTSRGLSLYQFLAPNAYPQLNGFVEIIDKKIISQVYNVMPTFDWHDDSVKYLHVDVRGLERYQESVAAFVRGQLSPRMEWLLSGSRVPFGTITESKVVLVLDCSYPVLTVAQVLQHQLRALLQEQLAHVKEFNLMSFGGKCDVWRPTFTQPSSQTLQEAWEWLLGMSPCGTANLMAALKCIFEDSSVILCEEKEEVATSVGIYLQLTTMPDQDIVGETKPYTHFSFPSSLTIHRMIFSYQFRRFYAVISNSSSSSR